MSQPVCEGRPYATASKSPPAVPVLAPVPAPASQPLFPAAADTAPPGRAGSRAWSCSTLARGDTTLADQEEIAGSLSAAQLLEHLVNSGVSHKQAESILAQLDARSAEPKPASDSSDTVPAVIKTEIAELSVSSRLAELEQQCKACDLNTTSLSSLYVPHFLLRVQYLRCACNLHL